MLVGSQNQMANLVNAQAIKPPDAASVRGLDISLASISAVDENYIWAVANVSSFQIVTSPASGTKDYIVPATQRTVPSDTGIIFFSSDRGESWSIQHIESGRFFVKVHFVDRMTGWVTDSSNTILNTKNAGKDWTKVKTPVESFWCDLRFLDESRGWALGANGKILQTINGGQEWRANQIPTTDEVFSLATVDEKTLWVIGRKGTAYETTDSGRSWRSRGEELTRLLQQWNNSEVTFRAVKFVNTSVGFIAADAVSRDANFNAQAVIFKTIDRGKTWTASIVPNALGIRSAEFRSDREAWVIPGNRANTTVRHTADGGRHWSLLRLPFNSDPSRLLFVDSKHGWLLNSSDTLDSDQIFRTNDGGKSWTEIRISKRINPQ